MSKDNKIKTEAGSFDYQIIERINNGHIPDIRHQGRNEWFYNNVWRDSEFVKMSIHENLLFLMGFLKSKSKILEVGCGPGHMSLELARNGHHVTAVDLSPKCIEIAKKTAANNIFVEKFGFLEYYCGDFIDMDLKLASYDAVMFYGSLSHFPDIDITLNRVSELLISKGLILIWDTSVELYNRQDAALLYFIRMLLSYCNHYFEKHEIPKDDIELEAHINDVLNELQYIDEDGENLQSPNDNSQTFKSMTSALGKRFKEKNLSWESSFYRNMIGGLRFENVEEERGLAKFIKHMESFFIKSGQLNPAFFYYVGQKR